MCSPFITTNVRWLDAKTFHFTSMETSGFKNHSRDGGWNRGTFKQTDHPFTVEHDRDIEFLVDKADVDESNATASIQNIARVFTETQSRTRKRMRCSSPRVGGLPPRSRTAITPETDPATITKENVYSYLKKCMAAGKLRRYKARGGLILLRGQLHHGCPGAEPPTLPAPSTLPRWLTAGDGVETRITDIDGVPIMEVIDDEVFYDAFKFDGENGRFEPIAALPTRSTPLIASPLTTKLVPKISSIYYFNPGSHTEGDGYLYQERNSPTCLPSPTARTAKWIRCLWTPLTPP